MWWSEADTYRLTTKQSQSSMHTILKGPLGQKNFESKIPKDYMDLLNKLIVKGDLVRLKALLPEGFLQRRLWCMNYANLRNIIIQRRNHRLPHWALFIESILAQVEHPELLPKLK